MSSEVRIGDAERERAAEALADHYAAGRLDHAEYVERLDAIWTARTRADLDMLFHDLPLQVRPQPVARRRGGPPFPVIVLVALVVGVVVLTHLPIILLLIAGVVLFKVARRRSRGCLGPHRNAAARW